MDERVPLILCIDVEPDEHTFPLDDPSPWTGFEALAAESERLRGRLADVTGAPARFTWSVRIDPQIADAYGDAAWIVDRHRGFFDDALAHGDSIGVHPHAWRWNAERRTWIADHEEEDWAEHCLEMSVGGYRSRFGVLPDHHRYGARFMSSRIMASVERIGIRHDLTLEPNEERVGPGPHLGGLLAGHLPDYLDVPREPFHPDLADYRRPALDGKVSLWSIPLTAGSPSSGPRIGDRLSHPMRSARGLARRVRRRVTARGRGSPRPNHRVLRLWGPRPDKVWDAAFASLKEIRYPYLAFGIRSDMHRETIRALESLFVRPEARNVVFTTPGLTLARLGLVPEIPNATATSPN